MSLEDLSEHEKSEQNLQDGRGPHASWVTNLATYEMRGKRGVRRANEVERKRDTGGQEFSRIRTEVLMIEIETAHIHARPPNVPLLSCGRIRKSGRCRWSNRARGSPPRATGKTRQEARRRGRQLQQLVGQQWKENGAQQDSERSATGGHGFGPKSG